MPGARLKGLLSDFQASLRDAVPVSVAHAALETPGYCRKSLRDIEAWLAQRLTDTMVSTYGHAHLLGGATVRMVLTVDDPDAVFAQAIAAGAAVVWPVADQDYGCRVVRVVDPFGHHFEIGKLLLEES